MARTRKEYTLPGVNPPIGIDRELVNTPASREGTSPPSAPTSVHTTW